MAIGSNLINDCAKVIIRQIRKDLECRTNIIVHTQGLLLLYKKMASPTRFERATHGLEDPFVENVEFVSRTPKSKILY